MDVPTVLVIILSVSLFLLVALSIVLVYLLIRVLTSLRHFSAKAETAADNLAETFRLAGKRVSALALSTLLTGAIDKVKRRRKEKRHGEE